MFFGFVNAPQSSDCQLPVADMLIVIRAILTARRQMPHRGLVIRMIAIVFVLIVLRQMRMGVTNQMPACHRVQECQTQNQIFNATRIAVHWYDKSIGMVILFNLADSVKTVIPVIP